MPRRLSPRLRGLAGLEEHALAGTRCAVAQGCRPDQRAQHRNRRRRSAGGGQKSPGEPGDVEETADLIRYYCDQIEANNGFVKPAGQDWPKHHNTSVLKPYGVWVVISPFNFPFALAGGPTGGALVAGNTVVFKLASDTPLSGWLLAECIRDAGLPAGVFNFVTVTGRHRRQGADHQFGGGRHHLHRLLRCGHAYHQDLCQRQVSAAVHRRDGRQERGDRQPQGRSGQGGDGCDALGLWPERPEMLSLQPRDVEEAVKDAFLQKLVHLTGKMAVGDPTCQDVLMGSVANKGGYQDYQRFAEMAKRDGKVVFGGHVMTEGDYGKGYFVAPTIIADLPLDHELWKVEMFLPLVAVAGVPLLDVAMRRPTTAPMA